MSQPNPADSQSPPAAILAPVYARRSKKRRLPNWPETIPWARYAIYGAIAFQALVVVVAAYFYLFPRVEPIADDLPPVPEIKRVAHAPLPIPAPKAPEPVAVAAPAKEVAKQDFVQCARIGTNVRFLKDPAEAFKRAKAENKMVFMVHLSGNLEDQEFT